MLNFIAIACIDIVALLIVLYMAQVNETLFSHKRKLITIAILSTAAVIVAECLCIVFGAQSAEYAAANTVANVVGFTLSPLVPVVMSIAFDPEYRRDIFILLGVGAINAAAVISSPFSGLIFSISPENVYSRGDFFWIYIFSYAVGRLDLFRVILKSMRFGYHKQKLILLFLFIFSVLGTSVQIFFPWLHTSWTCVTFSVVIYYALICEHNNKQDILTTLYNQKVFFSVSRHFETAGSGFVITCDIDDFKKVNDRNGHSYGDYCLNRIGMLLRTVFVGIGLGYRVGGDEFCLVCENASEASVSGTLADFEAAVASIRKKDERFPSVSFGYAPFSGGDFKQALETSDRKYVYLQAEKQAEKIRKGVFCPHAAIPCAYPQRRNYCAFHCDNLYFTANTLARAEHSARAHSFLHHYDVRLSA